MHMRTFFLSGYNNGDYDMWRVGREQTIEVRDHQTTSLESYLYIEEGHGR